VPRTSLLHIVIHDPGQTGEASTESRKPKRHYPRSQICSSDQTCRGVREGNGSLNRFMEAHLALLLTWLVVLVATLLGGEYSAFPNNPDFYSIGVIQWKYKYHSLLSCNLILCRRHEATTSSSGNLEFNTAKLGFRRPYQITSF